MSDHGGEVLSIHFGGWLRSQGIFHLTAPKREPNYNAVVERSSAAMEGDGICDAHSFQKAKELVGLCF